MGELWTEHLQMREILDETVQLHGQLSDVDASLTGPQQRYNPRPLIPYLLPAQNLLSSRLLLDQSYPPPQFRLLPHLLEYSLTYWEFYPGVVRVNTGSG